jgi:hypothetical protein
MITGMKALRPISVLIWKKTCTDLFIAYFNIELKSWKQKQKTGSTAVWCLCGKLIVCFLIQC